MRLINILFENFDKLDLELTKNNINQQSGETYFIQIFVRTPDKKRSQKLIDHLKKNIDCHILLTQSSNEIISNGRIQAGKDLISISCFNSAHIKQTYCSSTQKISQIKQNFRNIISDKTKLLIIFVANGSFYHQDLLSELKEVTQDIIIAGGRSHPFDKNRGLIGDNEGVYEEGLVALSINSDTLYVNNGLTFGWEAIGPKMKITKAKENIVYEINNQSAISVYKKYLGELAFENFATCAYLFPLVYYINGIAIARVSFDITEDGGIVFNDKVPEGSIVNFTFGCIDNIKEENARIYATTPNNSQAFYFYSCIGRLIFLGQDNLDNLLHAFNDDQIPSSGFFTYGEIYHTDDCNLFLSLTNTFVCLTEEKPDFSPQPHKFYNPSLNQQALILNTMAHLCQTANQEIIKTTNKVQSYQHLVDKTMLHIVTDKDLRIIYVNQKIGEVSGYLREEVLGKDALNFLELESREYVIKNVLPTLQEKHEWIGQLKQKRKNGSPYYVKAIIRTTTDEKGEITSFLIGEIDVTDDEIRRISLEQDANFLKRTDEEKRYLLQQYEEVINNNQCFFRLDLQNNFLYVNEIFSELTGLDPKKIIGKNLYEFITEEESKQFLKAREELSAKGTFSGILEYIHRGDHKKRYIKSASYIIKNIDGDPVEIVAVGSDITQIINNVKEIENIQKDVIYAMGTICEGKSRETGNHIIRVAEYSALLAKIYGLNEQDQELLRIASPMHDIGKVGIPDSILNKPGKLTPEEFEIIKTHTTIGEEIFKNSDRLILKTAGEIAGTHHEWWNGNGYPKKLKGEEIPLFGRITALADTFDALSNDRCYKKAWPLPDVIKYIQDLKGKQFQPQLVDLFLENLDEFLKISKSYQDSVSST